MPVNVKIKKLSEKAKLPTRSHSADTGYDLTFTDVKKIEGDVIFFKTDLSMQPSSGYYIEVVPRSSISKLPLGMANSVGIIDQNYTGEILIPVRVFHENPGFETKRENYPNGLVEIWGRRPQTMLSLARLIIAEKPSMFQMIIRKKYSANFMETDLDDTERSDGGFGSTDSKTKDSDEKIMDITVEK